MKKIFKWIFFLKKWLYVKILGRFFYDKKYLKGRWFDDGIYSWGWIWAAEDIRHRIHTLKNLTIKWPVSPYVVTGSNVFFDPDNLDNMNGFGNYYQTWGGGKIVIGKGTYIANNVAIITSNHKIDNLDEQEEGKDVILGERCWIGINSVILPGVTLGDHTIVGAGSVVTKSFPEGECVIVGNPAKVIRRIGLDK